MLKIEVCKIRGKCPVHKLGDKIIIKGAKIMLEETDAVCVHALSSLLHYVIALDEGVDPQRLGLSKEGGRAYIQCVDPGEPFTSGGTVVFRCQRVKEQ